MHRRGSTHDACSFDEQCIRYALQTQASQFQTDRRKSARHACSWKLQEVGDEPLRLSVEFLSPCQGRFAVWLRSSTFRRLAICTMVSKIHASQHNARYRPLVCFLSLLRFLRKLSWLNGLAESFCGEATLSAVEC